MKIKKNEVKNFQHFIEKIYSVQNLVTKVLILSDNENIYFLFFWIFVFWKIE